jgi:hypothetical protein
MSNWRDMAASALSVSDNEEPPVPEPVTGYGLDADLYRSLSRLSRMPPPPGLVEGAKWGQSVRDALRLAREGWAASALALDWSVYDLFGVGPRDSWEFEGLAVWLAGRPVVLLDERRCVAGEGDERETFQRGGPGHGTHPVIAPVLLWQFGRTE